MKDCITPNCGKIAGTDLRGLCMRCYSSAKKLVDSKSKTWDELESLGMVQSKHKNDPFTAALNAKTKLPDEDS